MASLRTKSWPLALLIVATTACRAFGQELSGSAAVRQLCEAAAKGSRAEWKRIAPDLNIKRWPGKLIQFVPDGTGHVTITIELCPDGHGQVSVLLRNTSEAPVMLDDPLVRSMQNLSIDDLVQVDGSILGGAELPPAASTPWVIATRFSKIESSADVAPPENKRSEAHPADEPPASQTPTANGVTRPELLKKVEPRYTLRARTLGISCSVELGFIVNPQGKAEEIRITKPCQDSLKIPAAGGRTGSAEARLNDLKAQRQQALEEAGLFRKRAAEVTDPEDRARLLGRAKQLDAEAAELQSSIATLERQTETERAKQSTTADENYSRRIDAAKDLDDNAVIAVMQYQFKPGMRDGKPVGIRASITVEFKPGP